MNEIDVQPVPAAQASTEETVVRVLRAARANDADDAKGRTRHSKQTDRCPPVSRFSAVLRCGGAWAPDEAAHVGECKFCKRVYEMFVTNIAAVSLDATIAGCDGATVVGRAATSEDTTADGARPGKQPPQAAAPDDTVTDDKRSKKKRG